MYAGNEVIANVWNSLRIIRVIDFMSIRAYGDHELMLPGLSEWYIAGYFGRLDGCLASKAIDVSLLLHEIFPFKLKRVTAFLEAMQTLPTWACSYHTYYKTCTRGTYGLY